MKRRRESSDLFFRVFDDPIISYGCISIRGSELNPDLQIGMSCPQIGMSCPQIGMSCPETYISHSTTHEQGRVILIYISKSNVFSVFGLFLLLGTIAAIHDIEWDVMSAGCHVRKFFHFVVENPKNSIFFPFRRCRKSKNHCKWIASRPRTTQASPPRPRPGQFWMQKPSKTAFTVLTVFGRQKKRTHVTHFRPRFSK